MAAETAVDGEDIHANRTETSLMLAVAPHLVHLDRLASSDDPDRTAGLVFRYTAPSLSTNGVTGRPAEATVELGHRLLARDGGGHLRPGRAGSAGGAAARRPRRPLGHRRGAGMTGRTVALMVGRSPQDRYSVHRGYVDGVLAIGWLPLIVPGGPGVDPDRAVELVSGCDALLLTGGADIDPTVYGAEPGLGEKDTDIERDQIEVAATTAMRAAGRPVLGICRGCSSWPPPWAGC